MTLCEMLLNIVVRCGLCVCEFIMSRLMWCEVAIRVLAGLLYSMLTLVLMLLVILVSVCFSAVFLVMLWCDFLFWLGLMLWCCLDSMFWFCCAMCFGLSIVSVCSCIEVVRASVVVMVSVLCFFLVGVYVVSIIWILLVGWW